MSFIRLYYYSHATPHPRPYIHALCPLTLKHFPLWEEDTSLSALLIFGLAT